MNMPRWLPVVHSDEDWPHQRSYWKQARLKAAASLASDADALTKLLKVLKEASKADNHMLTQSGHILQVWATISHPEILHCRCAE